MSDAAIKAALIRDHLASKTPARCDPMFLDGDGWWKQVRYWPELGLARHDIGPHGKRSQVQRQRYWAHDLLSDTYETIDAVLAALDTAAVERAAKEGER